MIQNRPSFLVTELVTNTKFMTITAHFYLNNYKRKDGKCQIFYDVTVNRERDRIPTGLYIDPAKWDNVKRNGYFFCRRIREYFYCRLRIDKQYDITGRDEF